MNKNNNMSPPSDKAVDIARRMGELAVPLQVQDWSAFAEEAVRAAHDPALGLDRSVCLRDVVEALTNAYGTYKGSPKDWALGVIEREFTAQYPKVTATKN